MRKLSYNPFRPAKQHCPSSLWLLRYCSWNIASFSHTQARAHTDTHTDTHRAKGAHRAAVHIYARWQQVCLCVCVCVCVRACTRSCVLVYVLQSYSSYCMYICVLEREGVLLYVRVCVLTRVLKRVFLQPQRPTCMAIRERECVCVKRERMCLCRRHTTHTHSLSLLFLSGIRHTLILSLFSFSQT